MLNLSCDIVCVGSGAGGLTAAIVTAEHGGHAIVVEKGERLGGVTAWSAGQVWIGANHLAAELGIEDSDEETCAYLDYISTGLGDNELLQAYVTGADEAVRFLRERAGVEFQVIREFPDYYFPRTASAKAEGRYLEVAPIELSRLGSLRERFVDPTPLGHGLVTSADLVASRGDLGKLGAAIAGHLERDERCGGAALSGALLAAAVARGVDLQTGTRAVRLVVEEGVVAGVDVIQGGQPIRISARAVLLATGGYDWNPMLVRSFEHVSGIESMAPDTVEGDHLAMAGEVGAMVASARPEATPLMLGFHLPGLERNGRPAYQALGGARPGSMFVNAAGRRFADETFYHDVGAALSRYDGADPGTPNRPAWLIFDAAHRARYPLGTLPPGAPLPDGLATEAQNLGDLATRIGVDPAGLTETVERFNAFCETGVDEDFGRGEVPWSVTSFGDPSLAPNPLLAPIATAPFYAIELTQVGMGIPSAGLQVDSEGRVQSTRGEPIAGLYAAGNAAARTDIPGYQSGVANGRGLMLGYRAALDAVGASSLASHSKVSS